MSDFGDIIVRFGLDSDQFTRGISQLNRQMKLVQSEFQAASSRLDIFGNTTEQLRLKASMLSQQIDVQRQKMDTHKNAVQDSVAKLERHAQATAEVKTRLDQAKAAYEASTASVGRNAAETQRLEQEVKQLEQQYRQSVQAVENANQKLENNKIKANQAEAALNRMENELKQVNEEAKKSASVFNRMSEQLQHVGQRMQSVGSEIAQPFAIAATAISGAIGLAVKKSMDFGAEMSRVGAIADASGSDLERLKQKALELGASTSKSATEVAQGMEMMATKGYNTNQIIAAMPGVIAAAEASGEDMALVADTVSSALNAFGLEASKSTHVADVLAMAANKTAAGVEDMQYTFKYAAPVAKTLGMSLEELAASAGIMSNAGIKGETAGTTLRGALLNLVDPSKEVSKVMDGLNLKVTDSKGNMLPFVSIIEQLKTKTQGMGNAQRDAALATLFGKEAVSGMIALIEAGSAKIQELTRSLENSGGASKEAADKMKDNLAGALQELQGAFETAQISIGDALAPAVRVVAEHIQKIMDAFNNLSPATQKFIAIGAAISAAVLGIVAVFGLVVAGIGTFISAFGAISGVIASVTGAIAGISFAPIIAGVAAVVAVGVLLYKNWDIVKAKAMEVWGIIGPYVTSAMTTIKSAITQAMTAVNTFVAEKLNELKTFWSQNGTQIMQAATNVWNGIKTVISTVMTVLAPVVSAGWAVIKVIIQSVWENIKGVISGAMSVIQGLIKVFAGVFTGDWGKAWEGVKQATVGAVQFLWNMIQLTLFGRALSAAKVFVTGFKAAITTGWTAIKGVFTSSISAVQGVVTRGWSLIQSTSAAVMNGIRSIISSAWNGIRTVITSVMNGIRAVISSVWNGIRSTISSVVNAIKTYVVNAFNALKTAVSTAMNAVKTTIVNIWNSILTFFRGINLTEIGRNIIEGLVNGISSMTNTVIEKARQLADLVKTTIQTALDIHSPSRETEKLGKWTGEGLAKGIEGKKDRVKKASKTLGEKALEGMKEATDKLETKLSGLKAQFELGEIINAKNPKGLLDFELKNLNEQFKIQQELVNRVRGTYEKLTKTKGVLSKETAEAANKYAQEAKTLSELAGKISDVRLELATNQSATARAKEDIERLNAEHERELANLDAEAGDLAELELKRRQTSESIAAQQKLVAELNREYEAARKVKGADAEETRKAYMEYIQAQTEQAKLEKELRNTNKAIIEQKNELEAANKKVQKESDKTNAKLREQQDEIKSTVEKVGELADKYRDDLAKAQEDYAKKVEDTNRKLLEDEQKLTDQYENELASRAKALRDFTGLFDAVQMKDVSGQQLLDNLRGQVDTFAGWQGNMTALEGRGLDNGLLQELRDMGPKAAGEIEALNSLSDVELTQYVSLWREKNQLAKNEATVQLQETKQEMYSKMANLRVQAAQQLQQYADEWKTKNEEITKNTTDELKKMVEEADKKGAEMVTRLAESITKALPGLKGAFAGMPGFPAMGGTTDASTIVQQAQQASGVIQASVQQKTAVVQNTQDMTQNVLFTWQQAGMNMAQEQESIRTKTVTLWQSLTTQLQTLWNKMDADLKKTWNDMKKFLFETTDSIKQRFDFLVDAANNWGINLMTNFISAVQSQFGRLHDVMFNMTQIVDSYMPHSPAKVGPLSTLDEWGPGMMGAFIDGIQDGMPALRRVVNQVAAVSAMAQPDDASEFVFGIGGVGGRSTTNQYGGNTININLPRGSAADQVDDLLRELRKRRVTI
ncbi:TP901 family phage tail tape measure protein [Aneurinibacillus soli]|uniref:Chromosome partition protein Smc n=1 Tax=Aneurinibacillus soli TaxID=1500254 RepID=A0A0U4NFW6_9BACL|nr:phage tail tape measure protein [Aneurinibacillus soli]PYE63432.1 TP901 family phage tail tape measure protein [Aneurinibacillus soli]BAU27636.1 Chromosome partition protein Smc [Aneurinibacillus soli]